VDNEGMLILQAIKTKKIPRSELVIMFFMILLKKSARLEFYRIGQFGSLHHY
jgi:hypothetical protein